MSDLPQKGGDERSRKPLKHLTESQANRTSRMSSPSSYAQARPFARRLAVEEFDPVSLRRDPQPWYSPPRMMPPLGGPINRPRLYTEFNGSNHYDFGPDLMHPQASLPYQDYEQDSKRYKVDDRSSVPARYLDPSFHHNVAPHLPTGPPDRSFEQGSRQLFAAARESRHDEPISPPPDDLSHPHLLWLPEDKQHLTELHCFVRKHCVFIFPATSQDVDSE